MVELRQVSMSFLGNPVLQSIDLRVQTGTTHVLLGSSGSGKSTLLCVIAGLLVPDSGVVLMGDLSVNSTTQPLVALQTGYVIQEGGLFPHLTAEKNVSLAAKLRGWAEKKTQDRVEDLAKLVEIVPSLLDRFPRELSGGQRQRVGLMRALMLDPPLLLLDEPLGALDPIVRSELQSSLKNVFSRLKKTVLLVTHDLGEAAYLGDEISLLHHGQIHQTATFANLARRPATAFVKQFLSAQRPPIQMKELLNEIET